MKKILIIIFMVTGLTACKKSSDFLDGQAITLDENAVFTDSTRTMAFLTGIYSDIAYSFNKGRWNSHGNTEQATDDAEYNFSGTGQAAVILYNGSISPTAYVNGNNVLLDFWNTPYANVRRANLMLKKLPTTPLSVDLQTRVKGETRFLRAWYYSLLMIGFGGVPLVGDNVYDKDDLINLPRATFANTVKYISDELDAAASLLPDNYTNSLDFGRITKGTCLALKSRVLLYAASPLFNGGAITSDPDLASLVSYPAANASYWQAAADAANAVISSNQYALYVDSTTAPGYGFYNVFLQRSLLPALKDEYIFGYYRPANRDMEGFYNPPSRGGAKNSMATQDLVDAFPMKNGLQPFNSDGTVNAASGYNPANPYINRDPRFNYSIIYNGATYFSTTTNNKQPVWTFINGTGTIPAPTQTADAYGVGTTTGYFSRKMCDENISANSSANTNRAWPLIRYAEILLNYAEAINEAGQTALAYPKLVELRRRAGIDKGTDGLYGLKANMTQAEMREVVRNERRVELAFEDHRWHDIRRWKIAMVVSNQFNKVMQVVKNSNGSFTYNRLESVRRHNFRPEMYLLPIPDPEIQKMPAMRQNPGW
jgi:hypothetical protein